MAGEMGRLKKVPGVESLRGRLEQAETERANLEEEFPRIDMFF